MTTRQIFLNRLRAGLHGLPTATIEDIVSDYDVHFAEAMSHGRTEQEAAARLGDPSRLARELRAEAGMNRWESERNVGAGLGAIIAVLGLATIDLFILLPVLLVVAAVVLSFLVAGIGVAIAGLALLTGALFGILPSFALSSTHSTLLGVGLTAGGASVTSICLLFIIGLVNILVRYGRLHVRAAAPAAQFHPGDLVL